MVGFTCLSGVGFMTGAGVVTGGKGDGLSVTSGGGDCAAIKPHPPSEETMDQILTSLQARVQTLEARPGGQCSCCAVPDSLNKHHLADYTNRHVQFQPGA